MKQYLKVLNDIYQNGEDKECRNGKTRSKFGLTMRYNLQNGFPALTTKKLYFKSVKAELLWLISGSRDVRELNKLGSKIWDANAYSDYWLDKAEFKGDVGRIYGTQWRNWDNKIDQLQIAIDKIKNTPNDRRILVSAWNPSDFDNMCLPPCHMFFQFYNSSKGLSLSMYQRSCDMFLGVPFNIASYSLLLSMVSQITGKQPYEFVHILGDVHIYHDHFSAIKEQLSRTPYEILPKLWLNKEINDINDFTMKDIKLFDYKHQGTIKAEMIV